MTKPIKYTINENYFDDVNTEEKAYILGLLYADGCNSFDKYNSITLTLKSEDKYILEKISKIIFKNFRPLYHVKEHNIQIGDKVYKCSDQYTLNIVNKHMSSKLNELGVVKNKSNVITFPYFINKNLYRHFIRGYFDGDGCITKVNRESKNTKYTEYMASFVSNREFCMNVKNILSQEININPLIIKHKNVFRLQMFGNNISELFLKWIYENNTICLKRKEKLYNELIEYKKNKKKEKQEKYKNIMFSKLRNQYSLYINDGYGKRKHRGYYKTLKSAQEAFKRMSN